MIADIHGDPKEIDVLKWMSRAALELVGQGALGYSFDAHTGYPLLISEWMDLGPASKYIRKDPKLNLCDTLKLVSPFILHIPKQLTRLGS